MNLGDVHIFIYLQGVLKKSFIMTIEMLLCGER
jgi:hypothetical protein